MSSNRSTEQQRHIGIGIAIGVAIGCGIGVALGNLAYGMGPGIALGVALGIAMSKKHAPKSGAKDSSDDSDEAWHCVPQVNRSCREPRTLDWHGLDFPEATHALHAKNLAGAGT